MKRQSKQKPANKKSRSQRASVRTAEVAQKAADHKPGLAEQLGSGERNGREGGQIGARLSQADILQLQRIHGNGYVQRLLVEFGDHNGRALQRQEEQQDQRSNEPGQTTQQPGSVSSNGSGPAPEDEKQGESKQESQAEGPKKEESGTKEEAASQEEKSKQPGKAGQKGEQLPERSQGSEQEAQDPGVESTTGQSVPGSQAGGPAAQGQSPQSAQEDPDFKSTINQVNQAAEQEKNHPPATTKAQEAQAAAQAPGSEVEARAQANQAREMEQAETPAFDAAGFKAQLMQRLQGLTPSTAQEAEQFKSSNKAGGLKAELKGKVEAEQKKSKGPMEEKSAQAPNTGAVPPKAVTPLQEFQAGPGPTAPAAQQAVPKPKSQSEVEGPIKQGSQDLDDKMGKAQITEEQLERSNEPEFQNALDQKKRAQEQAQEAPSKYREEEQEQISQAQSEAAGTAESKLGDMHGQREGAMTQVGSKQGQTKDADEQKRAQVAADIQGLFAGTKSNVEQILGDLDGRVDSIFNSGAEAAKNAFENYVDSRMQAYKEERYSGATGLFNWAKDKLLGMPSEVNAFFQQGRQLYLDQMDGVIDNVVSVIGDSLQQAKEVIAAGRAEIDAYVAQLPADLQEVGQQAAGEIAESFDQLESQVDETQNALINELADLYNQHLREIDDRVSAMRAENRGLIQKVMDVISGVVQTILEIKNRLLSILTSAAGAISDILKDPIGFLSNLVNAVSTGFQNFVGNIATHLTGGLISWLAKVLGDAGIDLPGSFDLKGIFGMVMQVMGVTWDTVRDRATSLLGENIVGQLEQVFDVFITLKSEGLAGIWEFVSGTIGNIKDIIFEPIQEFLVTEVIQKGIQKILGLLGGSAQAFINAAKSIHDIVSWFIGQAQNIASLVRAVMESMVAIASGSVGQAVQLIEQAMARAIPATISFLANVLGLGDLGEKIKEIIQRIRAPIDRVINWIVSKAVKVARKIGGTLGAGGEGEATGGR